MAEGWAKHLKGDCLDAHSAGIAPHGVDPLAVQVMGEAGVDISDQRSKHLDDLAGVEFDFVITLCGDAREKCPVFPRDTKVIHAGFDDPPRLAREADNEIAAINFYRRVRDEIRAFVETLDKTI